MLTCNVVKDLLPNYVDGLVSEQTEREITEHLAQCVDCQTVYKQMEAPIAPIIAQDKKEIDYLKKIRAKSKSHVLKYSAISTGVVLALVAVFLFIFMCGTPVNSNDLDYTTRTAANGDCVIEMTLETTSALSVGLEMIYEGEGGMRTLKEIILSPRQVPEFFQEGNRYSYGISGDIVDQFQSGDFSIIMKFADRTVELTPGDFNKD
jgi:hypothetical protein